MQPGAFRDRMTMGTYVSRDPRDPIGLIEDALEKTIRAEPIESKFTRALKQGIITRRLDRDAISDAIAAEVITMEEAVVLRAADEAADRAIRVDEFDPDELASHSAPQAVDLGRAAE
jgi:acyl-CoA dehydrogenase